jgi:ribosomal protein S21
MIVVQVNNGDINRAIKVLKLRLSKDGVLHEAKQREYYLSRSERRKAKDSIAQHRKQKHSRFKVWKKQEKKKRGH